MADVAWCLGCNKSQQKLETLRRSLRVRLSSRTTSFSVRRVEGVPRERVQSTEEEEDANGYM